ncbi:hypothetical protein [Blastomonas sp.]|uniref:hypothetical protein n=1 Tax=Blastomonas sp. TaxID=1909299 RepID=UPI00391C6783
MKQRLHWLRRDIGQRNRGFAGGAFGAHPTDMPALSATSGAMIHVACMIQRQETPLPDAARESVAGGEGIAGVKSEPGEMHRHVLFPHVHADDYAWTAKRFPAATIRSAHR